MLIALEKRKTLSPEALGYAKRIEGSPKTCYEA